MSEALTVMNNQTALAKVAAQQNALSRLFQLKPVTIELVPKATQQENATPGKFRNTATGAQVDTIRAVMLFSPVEQRALYKKGEFSQDAKLCFSLDNFQPHPQAKEPKAMYCATCPFGDVGWEDWREAKKNNATKEALSALVPPCRKYWHLFIVDRQTKQPAYFNVKGTSVVPFEASMQNMARIFSTMWSNIKLENQKIKAENAKLKEGEEHKPYVAMPQSIDEFIREAICKISFTMSSKMSGGQWVLVLDDFAVLDDEAQGEFGAILKDFAARRSAGKAPIQAEAEAEAVVEEAVAEEPATTTRPQIQI